MNDDDLTAIDGLQDRVDKLRHELRAERHTREWQGLAVVALIVFGALVNGWLLLKVNAQADQLAETRVADCERNQEARTALLGVTDALPHAIISALIVASDEGRTPEEQARVDRILAEATRIVTETTRPQRDALVPRDCSQEAVNP